MKLDYASFHRGTRTPPATKAFANGPTAIVRVETVTRPDELMKQLVPRTAEGAARTLQAVSEPLRELTDNTDGETASGASYGVIDTHTGTRASVSLGCELRVHTPVMFTVSLKQGGVEKACVIAKAQPGAQRV